MQLILFLITSIIVTYLLTKVALKYAIKTGLFDLPNKRSSHVIKTARGGGISIVITFLVILVFLSILTKNNHNSLTLSLLSGGLIVSILGFWDDHRDISAKWRFIIHFIAAFISLQILVELPNAYIFSVTISFTFLLYFLYSMTLVWLLNLYNFMDGIDGIASIEAITVLVSAALIFYIQGNSNTPQLLLILSSCVIGFLFWNWPPAKIFMGDACSGFLGFTIGLMAISTSNSEEINLWSWLILLSVFVVDATYTLIRRIIRGDKWYEAHRSHAYQILARYYNSHKKVTLGVLAINIFWLFPFAYLAAIFEYWAPAFTLIAISPLVFIDYKVGAGTRND